MSDVSGTSRSNNVSTARPAARAPQRATPPAEDVRAMGEAFRRARGGVSGQPDGPAGKTTGKGGVLSARGERSAEAGTVEGRQSTDDRAALERRDGERHSDQGFGGLAQQGNVPVVIAAQAPPPHVDAAGFAQMLADLWTRENGRGPREVRVRFGTATWPATGARLVRSADGLLDVTVEMAPGSGDARVDGLETALEKCGLSIGRVAVTADDEGEG